MKQGVLIQSRYKEDGTITKVKYEINPYDYASGLLLSVQRFAVILFTTKGTDPIRPWFGTKFNSIAHGNVGTTKTMELNIRDTIRDAHTQLMDFQNSEANLTDDDRIKTVDLVSFTIDESSRLIVTLMFTGYTDEAVTTSLGG